KPSRQKIDLLIDNQRDRPFSYQEVGVTRDWNPGNGGAFEDRYRINHRRFRIGTGEAAFERARQAFSRWEMFNLDWVRLCWPESPIEQDATLAILGRVLGMWTLNMVRVVYTLDETGPITRFGFAAGTLPIHVMQGEERFLVEWERESDAVWYEVMSFSKESNPVVRMGMRQIQSVQKRFSKESAEVMSRCTKHQGDS
ncbi:MAG: DUF1990 domain-containing protein, partial [Gammaproteobacteria bacterium]|nr:DUF1990 domain-containing protein [Gammaproteobacteria bacterium]